MDKIKDIVNQIEDLKALKLFNEAIELIQETIKDGDDYRLYEELADIYLYTSEKSKDKKAIDFALKINPDSATWNYLKWFIMLATNKFEESIEFLKKSNSLMQNNPEVLRNLWWAYTNIWEPLRGIAVLKRWLNITPNDELILEDLAMSYISIWEVERGNEILRKIWREVQK